MEKRKKLLFYGPTGRNTPPHKLGGGERGCQRTLCLYQRLGVTTVVVEKPVMACSLLLYLLRCLSVPVRWTAQLLRHPGAPAHIVGFYEKQLWMELTVWTLARLMGRKTVYELRNGNLLQSYANGGRLYRAALAHIIRHSDALLCQGISYIGFFEKEWHTDALYYPNYLLNEDIPDHPADRERQPLQLVYSGRIVPEKHVETVVRTAMLLAEQGLDIRLHLVGGYDPAYKEVLDRLIAPTPLANGGVLFHGRKPFDELTHILNGCHYFLFPSGERKEGHSNALTEAMAMGVVPVVSSAGFNRQVCGDDSLTLEGYNPEDYAKVILRIEKENSWQQLSVRMNRRVRNHYSETQVGETLRKALRQIE